jgi:hypothetical protein
MAKMKIGFLDHHLNTSHSMKFLALLRGSVGQGDIEITGAWESDPEQADWCESNGVVRMANADEVVAASDAIIVLAPNNPEVHLDLARPALEAGKPVFIDKDLAGCVKSAREIARLSDRHGAPVMAASALRFASELDALEDREPPPYDAVFARGLGKWHGYSVHTITMAMRLFGSKVLRVIDTGSDEARSVTLDDGHRRCNIDVRVSENQSASTPWQVGCLVSGKYETATITRFDQFYTNLMQEVVEFFRTGTSPISMDEMIMTVAIEKAADLSLAEGGHWVELED